MSNFSFRSSQKELLDEPYIPQADLFQNLKELAFINTYLGGHQVVVETFKSFIQKFPEAQIIEIGSGGGDNLAAAWFTRDFFLLMSSDVFPLYFFVRKK